MYALRRNVNLLGAVICGILFGMSLYLQHIDHISPCLLCILQRDLVGVLTVLFLMGGVSCLKNHWLRVSHALAIVVVSVLGVMISGRHFWLQRHPDRVSTGTCLPSLGYMFQHFSVKETAHLIIQHSGECTKVNLKWAGLPLPAWLLVLFFVFFGIGVYNFLNRPKQF